MAFSCLSRYRSSTRLFGGGLLLSNRFVPLGLVLLGPDILNILAYHILLDHRNWTIAVLNLVLFLILVWSYREYFKSLFVAKAEIE
jgi:putative oxidoreductase